MKELGPVVKGLNRSRLLQKSDELETELYHHKANLAVSIASPKFIQRTS